LLTWTHHAELLRTYRPPWRGLTRKATSPRGLACGLTKNFSPWSTAMYDMYPEWGPARNRDNDDDQALASVQHGLDLRDNGGERPDDS
jgi:hypothetical protein